ncbi:MAG TPA: hypothetical protein VFY41_05320 [Nitrososphaeraceae archaeon]|nr:hypothetical protein [Nitrososphaeraceae archaeon]
MKISVLKGGFLSSGYLNFISKCGLPEGISIVYNVNLNMGTRIKSSANVNWSNSVNLMIELKKLEGILFIYNVNP